MSSQVAKRTQGSRGGRGEQPSVSLLDDVEEAARRVRELDQERHEALAELRRRVVACRAEQIPYAVIARRTGYSRERVRQLNAPD